MIVEHLAFTLIFQDLMVPIPATPGLPKAKGYERASCEKGAE
jgi:hypothetical protein